MNNDSNLVDSLVNDPVFSNGPKIGILLALYGVKRISFTDLQRATGIAKSSLYIHLQALQNFKYITVKTEFTKRRPRTVILITSDGEDKISNYFELLKKYFGT